MSWRWAGPRRTAIKAEERREHPSVEGCSATVARAVVLHHERAMHAQQAGQGSGTRAKSAAHERVRRFWCRPCNRSPVQDRNEHGGRHLHGRLLACHQLGLVVAAGAAVPVGAVVGRDRPLRALPIGISGPRVRPTAPVVVAHVPGAVALTRRGGDTGCTRSCRGVELAAAEWHRHGQDHGKQGPEWAAANEHSRTSVPAARRCVKVGGWATARPDSSRRRSCVGQLPHGKPAQRGARNASWS